MRVESLVWMGVRTERFQEMAAFYRDVLGLETLKDEPNDARFRLDDGTEVHTTRCPDLRCRIKQVPEHRPQRVGARCRSCRRKVGPLGEGVRDGIPHGAGRALQLGDKLDRGNELATGIDRVNGAWVHAGSIEIDRALSSRSAADSRSGEINAAGSATSATGSPRMIAEVSCSSSPR